MFGTPSRHPNPAHAAFAEPGGKEPAQTPAPDKPEIASGGTGISQPEAPEQKRRLSGARRLLPRLLLLFRPYLPVLVVGFASLAAATGINLLFPYLIRSVLNEQFGLTLARDLGLVTFGLIALFALQALFFYVRHYCFQSVGYRIVTDLRRSLFKAILRQDVEFFDRSRLGDILSRLSSDTEVVQRALTINISVALRYLIQVIGGTALMLVISVRLTLVILVLVPCLVFCSMYWGRKLRALSRTMQRDLGSATVVAEEAISAIRTVRVFAGDEYENTRYQEAVDKTLATGIERTRVAAFFSSFMVFLMHAGIALMIWYGGSLVLQGKMTMGDLTGFLLYCVIVAVSFGFLVGTWVEFLQAAGASERIFEIMDSKPLVTNPPNPRPIEKNGAASVSLEHVTFAYPSRSTQPVLHDLSFEIAAGKTLALVGPSGAGKSTIASLIPRFYDPQSGIIRYCGIPLPELDLDELRKDMSIVAQQPQVFSLSVGENIHYGRLSATREEIIEAAKAANIHLFIESLPQGYETLVGDKGVQLSGGERQRIAIARALLKNPRFLILDEATSALDSENEFLVRQALERLMRGRTTLVIAHRLSTVQHADHVMVLEAGRICQEGKHEDLLKVPGMYQTLVQHQLLT